MAAFLPALAWARDGREYRGPGPFWWGGSYVASRGFASGSGLGEGEFLDLGLFIEPFQSRFLSPALAAGALLPLFPFEPAGARLWVGVDLVLFSLRRHPFAVLVDQTSWLCPSLGAYWLAPAFGAAGGDGGLVTFSAAPLRLRTGDARYSLLAPELVSRGGGAVSWGLRVFELWYFLF